MQKNKQIKGYAVLNVPDPAYSEIIKPNGVELKFEPLVLEEVKPKHTDRTLDKQNSLHHQFTNYYLNIRHQHEQQRNTSIINSNNKASKNNNINSNTYKNIIINNQH